MKLEKLYRYEIRMVKLMITETISMESACFSWIPWLAKMISFESQRHELGRYLQQSPLCRTIVVLYNTIRHHVKVYRTRHHNVPFLNDKNIYKTPNKIQSLRLQFANRGGGGQYYPQKIQLMQQFFTYNLRYQCS